MSPLHRFTHLFQLGRVPFIPGGSRVQAGRKPGAAISFWHGIAMKKFSFGLISGIMPGD